MQCQRERTINKTKIYKYIIIRMDIAVRNVEYSIVHLINEEE